MVDYQEILREIFNGLSDMYELTFVIDENNVPSVYATPLSDSKYKFLPKMDIETVEFVDAKGRTCYDFNFTLSDFPTMSEADENEFAYADSMHYELSKLADIGTAIDSIHRNPFSPESYVD